MHISYATINFFKVLHNYLTLNLKKVFDVVNIITDILLVSKFFCQKYKLLKNWLCRFIYGYKLYAPTFTSIHKKKPPKRMAFSYLVKSELLRDNASHFQHFVRVAPLVVVPSANFNESRIKLDTSFLVKD